MTVSFFWKDAFFHAEYLMNELCLKKVLEVTDARSYHAKKERIHSKGILMLNGNQTPYHLSERVFEQ
jgi:hypothetical protein